MFSLSKFLKLTEVAKNWATIIHGKRYALLLINFGLGNILADLFKNSPWL
jgi:hypothetical protein